MLRALIVLLLIAPANLAWAETAQSLWAQATQKMAQAQEREAVDLLKTLIHDHPRAALTDDALFLAATLLEEKLGDPAQARSLYQKLTQDFPDSRSALASQRRLRSLERALGPDDAGAVPLAAFQDILNRYAHREAEESLALAHTLLQTHPEWTEAHRVRLWIAETSRRLGDLKSAGPLFEAVRASDAPSHALVQASLGAADVDILQGQWAAATRVLDTLATRPDLSASNQQALTELRSRLALSAKRARLVNLSYLVLASMLVLLLAIVRRIAGSWSGFADHLRAPPIEILYMLPFALLFTIMAFTGHREIGPAVAIISGGGLVVTWLTASALSGTQALRRGRALVCGSAATLATLSLCYLALHRGQLLDLLRTTLEFGPE